MAEQQAWAMAHYELKTETGELVRLAVSGRFRWALDELIKAGDKGCTTIDNPAPRWSAYKHGLMGMGLPIVTVRESHSGPFAGHHGRYILKAKLT